MLKNEKSAKRNDHQNRKSEVFCNKNRKTDLKISQNRKTENLNARLAKATKANFRIRLVKLFFSIKSRGLYVTGGCYGWVPREYECRRPQIKYFLGGQGTVWKEGRMGPRYIWNQDGRSFRNLVSRALYPFSKAREKRPGDEVGSFR